MVLLGAIKFLAMQSAKARIPSIKFRYGVQTGHQAAQSSAPVKQAPRTSQSHVVAAQVTVGENQLPSRFNRQNISEEEIEYINRGGPA